MTAGHNSRRQSRSPQSPAARDTRWSPADSATCLGRGFARLEQHEVAAVVEPGLVKDALYVGCGRCRGDVEGRAIGRSLTAGRLHWAFTPGTRRGHTEPLHLNDHHETHEVLI